MEENKSGNKIGPQLGRGTRPSTGIDVLGERQTRESEVNPRALVRCR